MFLKCKSFKQKKTTHKVTGLNWGCQLMVSLAFEVQGDCLAAVIHTEFFKQIPDVVFDGALGNEEFPRDLLVALAQRQRVQHQIRETRVEHDDQFKDTQASATTREIANAEHHIRHTERLREIIESDIKQWPLYQTFDRRERNFFIRKKILKNLVVNTQGRPGQQQAAPAA